MENPITIKRILQQTGNIIGKSEYQMLLKLPKPSDDDNIVAWKDYEEAQEKIKSYEEMQERLKIGIQKNKDYIQSLVDKNFDAPEYKISAENLYKKYIALFKENVGKPFDPKNEEALNNLLPLIFYFSKDERFFNCQNLSNISEPSFKKGLLIIGNYGNGKTTALFILENIFKGAKGKSFKGFTTNDIVVMYEACDTEEKITEFDKLMKRGDRYFDDLCSERHASRYGKVNTMKEVLENRYNTMKLNPENPIKTFCTMNFDDDYPNDIQKALELIGVKYGSRIYDRVFEMFNVLVFKGKSFRK